MAKKSRSQSKKAKTTDKRKDLRPRRSPVQDRSRETIDLILNAAAELLESGGAGAVTTNKIAERAGLSVGSLYHFFNNKQSILAALFERQLGRFDERVVQLFAPEFDELPVNEFIDRVMDTVGNAYLETPALAILLITMQTDPALDNISLENRDRFAGWVHGVLARRIPHARKTELQAAAVVIVETVNAVFRRWMAMQDRPAAARALLSELKQNVSLFMTHRFS